MKVLLLVFVLTQFAVSAQVLRDCTGFCSGPPSDNQGKITVQQCIGQSGIIGTFASHKTTLRQGYLQPPLGRTNASKKLISELKIYPNPTMGQLRIELKGFEEGSKQIQIFDSFGRLIWSEQLTFYSATFIDISALPSGLYFLRVREESQMAVAQIQKL